MEVIKILAIASYSGEFGIDLQITRIDEGGNETLYAVPLRLSSTGIQRFPIVDELSISFTGSSLTIHSTKARSVFEETKVLLGEEFSLIREAGDDWELRSPIETLFDDHTVYWKGKTESVPYDYFLPFPKRSPVRYFTYTRTCDDGCKNTLLVGVKEDLYGNIVDSTPKIFWDKRFPLVELEEILDGLSATNWNHNPELNESDVTPPISINIGSKSYNALTDVKVYNVFDDKVPDAVRDNVRLVHPNSAAPGVILQCKGSSTEWLYVRKCQILGNRIASPYGAPPAFGEFHMYGQVYGVSPHKKGARKSDSYKKGKTTHLKSYTTGGVTDAEAKTLAKTPKNRVSDELGL